MNDFWDDNDIVNEGIPDERKDTPRRLIFIPRYVYHQRASTSTVVLQLLETYCPLRVIYGCAPNQPCDIMVRVKGVPQARSLAHKVCTDILHL